MTSRSPGIIIKETNMKSLVLGLIAAAGVAAALPAAAQTPVDARAQHQEARIQQGARTGDLTRPEARRLQRKEVKLHRIETRMKMRHGGHLTRHDIKKLNHIEDAHRRAIAKLKRN